MLEYEYLLRRHLRFSEAEFWHCEVDRASGLVRYLKLERIQDEIIKLMSAGMDPSKIDRYRPFMPNNEETEVSEEDDKEDFDAAQRALKGIK